MIKSVEKALKILSILSDGEYKPVTLAAIARAADINKSTCAHIISTLTEQGYAQRVSHREGYILGPQAYYLTRYGKYDDEFISLCRPVMKWLHKRCGYTIVLAVIQADKKFIIDYIDTDGSVLSGNEEIRTDDIYRTATGRAILANMHKSEVKSIFEKYGVPHKEHWQEVNSWDTLVQQLHLIKKNDIVRTQSVRQSDGEIMIAYGRALFANTNCMGAIGIAAHCSRSEYDNFSRNEINLKKLLNAAATEINRRLSYR